MSLAKKHLQIFLQNAQSVLSEDVLQITELGILCINCFEVSQLFKNLWQRKFKLTNYCRIIIQMLEQKPMG